MACASCFNAFNFVLKKPTCPWYEDARFMDVDIGEMRMDSLSAVESDDLNDSILIYTWDSSVMNLTPSSAQFTVN